VLGEARTKSSETLRTIGAFEINVNLLHLDRLGLFLVDCFPLLVGELMIHLITLSESAHGTFCVSEYSPVQTLLLVTVGEKLRPGDA
jgi:hypothetical protein